MSLIATEADFNGGWYANPNYTDYPFFAERAAEIQKFGAAGIHIVVAGCGYGYLVKRLFDLGYNAWGFDASTYAIDQGKALLPSIASRLTVADALSRSSLADMKSFTGKPGGQKVTAFVVEDLLTCMTDAEASTALAELRRIVVNSSGMFHIVTDVYDTTTVRNPIFNWKTLAEWKAFIGAETVYGAESRQTL